MCDPIKVNNTVIGEIKRRVNKLKKKTGREARVVVTDSITHHRIAGEVDKIDKKGYSGKVLGLDVIQIPVKYSVLEVF